MLEKSSVDTSYTGGKVELDIIEEARRLRMRVYLLSNASLLNEEIARKLAGLYISEFSTTVFSMDENIHDGITGVRGSLSTTIKNMELLKKNNICVKVKTPLIKDNANCYREVAEYTKKMGFEFRTSPVLISKSGSDSSIYKMRIEGEELQNIVNEIEKKYPIARQDVSDIPCAALFRSFAIQCNGDVNPCNSFFLKVGNVLEQPVKEIWNNSPVLKEVLSIRNGDLTECVGCENRDNCNRCPALAWNENKDNYGCYDYAKEMALIHKNIEEGRQ